MNGWRRLIIVAAFIAAGPMLPGGAEILAQTRAENYAPRGRYSTGQQYTIPGRYGNARRYSIADTYVTRGRLVRPPRVVTQPRTLTFRTRDGRVITIDVQADSNAR